MYSISLSGILGLLITKPRSHFCFPPLHCTVCYETLLIPSLHPSTMTDPATIFINGSCLTQVLTTISSSLFTAWNSSKPVGYTGSKVISYVSCTKPYVLNMPNKICIIWRPFIHSLFWSPFSRHDLLIGLLNDCLLHFSEAAKLIQALGPPYLELVSPIFSFSLVNSCYLKGSSLLYKKNF